MNRFGSLPIALLFTVLIYPRHSSLIKVKFTNLECKVHDAEFCTIKRCELKALARDTVSLYGHLQIHKLPIESATINAAFFIKGNGYRPFMYNNTIDICKFFKNPKGHMFWNIFYDMFKHSSNINHSCPFNHDLIVNRMILNADMFKLIPFASNSYMIRAVPATENRIRAEVRVYFQIYD